MQTLINVVNNQVVVRDTNTNRTRIYSYSAASFLSAKSVTTSLVGEGCLSTTNPERIKAAYTKAGNILGVSVASYVHQIKGAAKRAYIDPIQHLIRRFCLIRVRLLNGSMRWTRDPYKVDVVNTHAKTIQEYIDEGNTHLAAYGMLLGNTQDAKNVLGKGLWKKICQTSKTRNDLIWVIVNHSTESNTSLIKNKIKYYYEIPSTLLAKLDRDLLLRSWMISIQHGITSLIPKIVKHIDKPMCKIPPGIIEEKLDMVNDTANMRNGFNPKWSIKRMINEHAAGIRDQLAKDFPKDLYNSAKFLTALYEHEGCVAELITSSFEIGKHGQEQKHCIGSYAKRSAIGEYVVYKLTDADGIVSTLGISNPTKTGFNHTQHLLAYNRPVVNKDILDLAEIIKSYTFIVMEDFPEMITKPLQQHNSPPIHNLLNEIPF